jgi:hypothetical protein
MHPLAHKFVSQKAVHRSHNHLGTSLYVQRIPKMPRKGNLPVNARFVWRRIGTVSAKRGRQTNQDSDMDEIVAVM